MSETVKTSPTPPPFKPPVPQSLSKMNELVELYGDMTFDLCQSIVRNAGNAQLAFRLVLKDLKRETGRPKTPRYIVHERAWVLRVACDRLLTFAKRAGKKLTSLEQIELDANSGVSSRLKQFDQFFRRLSLEDQMILLLRDKYGLPFPEISAAMAMPVDSLKMRRQQALGALEGWLWELER